MTTTLFTNRSLVNLACEALDISTRRPGPRGRPESKTTGWPAGGVLTSAGRVVSETAKAVGIVLLLLQTLLLRGVSGGLSLLAGAAVISFGQQRPAAPL